MTTRREALLEGIQAQKDRVTECPYGPAEPGTEQQLLAMYWRIGFNSQLPDYPEENEQ